MGSKAGSAIEENEQAPFEHRLCLRTQHLHQRHGPITSRSGLGNTASQPGVLVALARQLVFEAVGLGAEASEAGCVRGSVWGQVWQEPREGCWVGPVRNFDTRGAAPGMGTGA